MRLIPTYRLLFWFVLIVLPYSLLPATFPAALGPGLVPAAGFLLAVVFDGLRSRNRLDGIRVDLPEIIRLAAGREGEIPLSIENNDPAVKQLRLGLAFPRQLVSPQLDIVARLPHKAAACAVGWPFRAPQQGFYRLDNCYLETHSALGFWSLRRTARVRTEIRVYPDLLGERKKLSGLFLNRGSGIHALRQVGKGREFEQIREYFPGDNYEDIHWKATARRGQPVTKIYQIERTQQIYVIIDASRLSARRAAAPAGNPQDEQHRPSVLERYSAAALVTGLAAERQGDVFGLLVFDDRVRTFLRAKNGRAHYGACREALYTLQARRVTPDFAELFTFVATRIRRRALLIVLSCLDDAVLAQNFVDTIDLVTRQHLVLVNMLKPDRAQPLFSDPAVGCLDDLYQHLGGHLLWRQLHETERFLHRRGVGFSLLENENLCSRVVSQYLSVKRRQVL